MKIKEATIIVDLNGSEDELIKRLHKNARWSIKKAIDLGVIVKESEDMKNFYKDYLKFAKEHILTPQKLEELENIKHKLFVCKYGGEIIGWLLLGMKSVPYAIANVSQKKYLKYCPNDILYWNAFLWARKKGFEEFDMGGYSLKPRGSGIGVTRFKEKYGKVVSTYNEVKFYHWFKHHFESGWIVFYWMNLVARHIRNNLKGVYKGE